MERENDYSFLPLLWPVPDFNELTKEVLAPLALDVQLRAEWFLKKNKKEV